MSLLQKTGVCHKTDYWHPALTPSGVMTSNISQTTETNENIPVLNARDAPRLVSDHVLVRTRPTWEVITEYVATSFVVAIIWVWLALALMNVIFPGEWALVDP